MITEQPCDYYLVRIRDAWVRLGFHSPPSSHPLSTLASKEEHYAYLRKLQGHDIEYLGKTLLPIKQDIDTGNGLGTKNLGHSKVLTCKVQRVMMTLKKPAEKTLVMQQREAITSIVRSQKELLERKADVEFRRNSKTG